MFHNSWIVPNLFTMNDFSLPPPEETLMPGNYVIATWDLETTDKHFDDLICQIGAYCPGNYPFNQYVLPAKCINPDAASKIHLQVVVHEGTRCLINTVTRQIIHSAVDERMALLRFIGWLHAIRACRPGVVLISHSTIKLDVPVLFQALHRHNLQDRFFEAVVGFGDSFGPFAMELKGQYPASSFQSLYNAIVGPRSEQHDAASDAEAVYKLLETAFGTPLSLHIQQIQRYCYSPRAMSYYVEWKHRLMDKSKQMKPLVSHISNWKVAGGIKWDLLMIGYDYPTLAYRYQMMGDARFSTELRYNVGLKKSNDYFYLTHTSDVDTETIVQTVLFHFRSFPLIPPTN